MLYSQNKDVMISDLPPKIEGQVFPLISFPNNKIVEEKINIFLQVSELEFVPKSSSDPFLLARTATNSYTNYVSFYEWKKLDTPKNILSLYMNGEATGAYPEMFDMWSNFDLRTGNYIHLEDLFTEEGTKFVLQYANSSIEKEIIDFIAELKKTDISDSDTKEMVEEQLMIYEDCLESIKSQNLQWFEYFFEKDSLILNRGRCSNHAMRALDDLWDYQISISYDQLKPQLTDFGKSLIFDNPKNIRSNNPSNRLYKGKIDGKYPVHFLINDIHEDESLSAIYWYDKQKKIIHLGGEFVHQHFSLVEDDYHDENLRKWIPRALIEADLKGSKIIGTWQDYKTKKFLKLELEEL